MPDGKEKAAAAAAAAVGGDVRLNDVVITDFHVGD